MTPGLRVMGIVLGAALLSAAAWGDDGKAARFVPATFGAGPSSLLRTVSCRKPPEPVHPIVVLCQAWVEADGQTSDGVSYCVADGGRRSPYSLAANEAVDRAEFSPASVDGASVAVYMSFRLVFRGDTQRCAIAAIANLGGELLGDDLDYFAPQEIVSEDSWYWRATRLHGQGGRSWIARPGGAVLTLSVAVSAAGAASDGRIEGNWSATRTEANAAVRALGKSSFIPGFRAGRAIPMRYVELLYVLGS
jgi:hypothetical protein